MKYRLMVITLAAGLLAGGSALALAQEAPMTPAAGMQRMMMQGPAGARMSMPGWDHDHDRGMRGDRAAGPAGQVIETLRQIEHLYRMDGKTRDIQALYENVLTRTQNPMVRRFAYKRLARAQMKPTGTRQAIATLRKSLDESLNLLNQADARRAAHRAARMGQGPGTGPGSMRNKP